MKFRIGFAAVFLWGAVVAGAAFATPSDDAAFLAAHGFPDSQFTLVWTWDEAAPLAAGRFITGYSLLASGAGARIDVYRDGDRLLSDVERQALGISAKHWETTAANAPAQPPQTLPKAIAPEIRPYGAESKSAIEILALPPYTPAEKALGVPGPGPHEKPSNQIGDFREFIEPITLEGKAASLGKWISLPGGAQLWRAGILSPGATGQRLHLAHYSLPEGARITVYNPTAPSEAFAQSGAGEDTWLPTIFNEEVILEVYAPTLAARDAVSLRLDRTVHIYADAAALQKSAGGCNLDVACYPDWAETALGICGLGIISTSGALFCTGTLLANTDTCSAAPPFVLTAHHCVGGQSGTNGASNLEFYWFYQKPTCGGTTPNLSTVPRTTGGADYLAGAGGTGATGGGNDFTLLRMHNAPPANATYVGWSAAVPALATEVTVIHHPSADFKRISFGTLTDTANTFASDFLESTWHNGTTEPGSSGSALMLTATRQIIGQLWGGGASCSALTDPDYFGRFSVSYPIIQSYIDPPPNGSGFASAAFHVSEATAFATVTVSLDRPAGASGLDVSYAAVQDTALAGTDFTPVSGTLHFNAGQQSQQFNVSLIDNTHTQPPRNIALSVSAPSCGQVSPTRGTAFVVIDDDDLDSDGDGLSDYDEVHAVFGPATNPNAADSDHDGLNDRVEVLDLFGYHTDPNNPDTDGDGSSDFFEILSGTDPSVPDAHLGSLLVPWLKD